MMHHPARTVVEIVEGSDDDDEEDGDPGGGELPEDEDNENNAEDKDADDDTDTGISDLLPESLKARRVAECAFLTALARDALLVGERVEVCSCY